MSNDSSKHDQYFANMRYTCIFVLFVSYVVSSAEGKCDAVYGRGVSETEQDIIVNRHNAIRLLVANKELPNQPKASNMKRISWDNSLAAAAQNISDTCEFAHKPVYDPRFPVGQNIYSAWASNNVTGSSWTSGIDDWFGEHTTYKFGTTQYNHYTQVVWADTIYVGCGYTHYKNNDSTWYKKFYVCNYGPAGNFKGETPYKTGPGCENLC